MFAISINISNFMHETKVYDMIWLVFFSRVDHKKGRDICIFFVRMGRFFLILDSFDILF